MAHSGLPKYRHFKLRNIGFLEFKRRRYYLPGLYGSQESLAAYRAKLAEFLQPADLAPAETVDGSLPIAVLADRYLIWAATYYGPQQTAGCIRDALRPLLMAYGRGPVKEFGPKSLAAIRDGMVRGSLGDWRAKRPWSRTYVNRQVDRIRRMFRWGVSEEVVPVAVYEALRTLPSLRKGKTTARETKAVGPVPEATVNATVAVMPPTLAAMVRIQAVVGMRPANVCAMRLAEIDRTGDVWVYHPHQHKTAWRGQGLSIFLGPKAQEILEPFLNRDPERFLFSPAEAWEQRSLERRARRKTPVQPSQQHRRKGRTSRPLGDCYTVGSYRKAVLYAIKLANRKAATEAAERGDMPPSPIAEWHPNQLRHAVGTRIRASYGLEAAQVYLGHTRADVTQVYAERNLALAKRIASEIG